MQQITETTIFNLSIVEYMNRLTLKMYLVEYHQMYIVVITYICASGVGRKFEVRWGGVGGHQKSCKLKKGYSCV